MTKAEAITLAKRVERWQQTLTSLGIGHWRIERVSVVDETPGGPDADASVQPSHLYDSCTFWFRHEFVDNCTERELDETIIHEWIHVAMRGIDMAIESVEYSLSRSERERWCDWVQHEREGLIERMARQLYVLHAAPAFPTPKATQRIARVSS